ncbi:MAG: hypothetical protein KGK03_08355 [Candidatus Omnitrophica bacterium]|nr:hypothetical protein [Candidatus Omnitrophota bacterium]MDE2223066.1 hypothetical protein [Candidatus Omnitrophota bacterium]
MMLMDVFSKDVIVVGIVSFIASLCDMLFSLVLGRSLNEVLFGKINFIFSLISLGVLTLTFSQQTVLIRILSDPDGNESNWRKFMWKIISLSAIAGVLYILCINLFYGLWREGIYIYIAMMLLILIEYLSSFLRAHHRFLRSILILKIPSVFCLCLAFSYFAVYHLVSMDHFLSFYSLCLLIPVFIGLRVLKGYPNGRREISASLKSGGMLFFLIGLMFILMIYVDRFLIVKILGYGPLGGYSAIWVIIKIYDFITSVFYFTLVPIYSRGKRLDSLKIDSVLFFILAALVSMTIFFMGPQLIHFMFHGRYDHVINLLKFFIITGSLKIMFIVPSGLICGYLPNHRLRQFFKFLVVGLIGYCLASYILIVRIGLIGASVGGIIIWAYLVVVGYWISFAQIEEERNVKFGGGH